MCGIFAYRGKTFNWDELKPHVDKIQYRGPDNSHVKKVDAETLFAFHRLAIMGTSESGDQPLCHPQDKSISIVCNGEIYNYKFLAKKYSFELTTGSDCEIILHLYKRFGIKKTVESLDGVFMFVLYDQNKQELFAGRDPFGVRPGFIGRKGRERMFASEAKPLVDLCDQIDQFTPGHWWQLSGDKFTQYYFHNEIDLNLTPEREILKGIRKYLINAVKKRMMAEREIGSLLSGGLDSSLITALVNQFHNGSTLKTFSIGMPGSVDLDYAKVVADHLGTDHHQIQISKEDFLGAIETVIYNIESFDTTTVRASVGNYLVSKYIRENSNCKVIFNGDGSDEVCGGYIYMKNAPTSKDFQSECIRLIDEIHRFDVLRSDRSISSNGLEARTPFMDKNFVQYYLSIPAEMKIFDGKIRLEKYLLRKAFDQKSLLPNSVLWRRKCAFSDGVSAKENSWHRVIQSFVDHKISDVEYETKAKTYTHCTPVLKESYYYRKVFESFFGKQEKLIPHFWMPKWVETNDPSARELSGYAE
ncbi:MAG: asparagine synthase B [Candidatus Marinimicrobia bacterium]|nr:asparagine synthase B [Candidatus Neomarinimicrobiota bacterium]MBL7030955.1 asparagine synthase B [Candidatus Neomarinimicrobiota bacterium]